MFKKTVQYEDFEGEQRSETMYFNLTTPELAKLEFEFDAGMDAYIREAVATKSNKKLFALFELIISLSYGRRTEDGKTFYKKKEFLDELTCSLAYEELFMWLFSDPNNASRFYTEIMPKNLEKRLEDMGAGKTTEEPTKNVREMTREELVAALQKKVAANEIGSDLLK